MVNGHDHIKMATSVIDYIFRELGLAYLGRTDLVHVKPEEIYAGTTPTPSNIEPRDDQDDFRIGYAAGSNGRRKNTFSGRGFEVAPSGAHPAVVEPAVPAEVAIPVMTTKARPTADGGVATMTDAGIARIKGYEGDPCSECGNFTLVRNGACMKCDTCGSTSGCS
jgi:ribonucleoside-diphosphate reductase alpha chain